MTSDTTHLIIGASLAGAKAAETLRGASRRRRDRHPSRPA
jgi:hypothetical protein